MVCPAARGGRAGADAATKDQIAKDYAAWLQSAQLADVGDLLGSHARRRLGGGLDVAATC
jgi:hypothetical protein